MIVDQAILGAVQEGICANINDTNPYNPDDKKKYIGWDQGHKTAIRDHQQRENYAEHSWFRKLLCKLGKHRGFVTKIPGRPHIDYKTGNIVSRDPIITKYTCSCCGEVRFINLDGGPQERKRRQARFAKQMGYNKRRSRR